MSASEVIDTRARAWAAEFATEEAVLARFLDAAETENVDEPPPSSYVW